MGDDDPERGELGREDPRLTSLDQRLSQAQATELKRNGRVGEGQGKGYSQGNRVLAELVGGIGGGALIGWLLDRWLETAPWFLLGLMFLGIAVALANIIRISGEHPK